MQRIPDSPYGFALLNRLAFSERCRMPAPFARFDHRQIVSFIRRDERRFASFARTRNVNRRAFFDYMMVG